MNVEQQTVLSVVTAFVDVRRAEREVEIRETNVTSLRQQVKAAKDRFDVGEVTRTDVSQAEAQAAASEAEFAKSKAALARARADLRADCRPPAGAAGRAAGGAGSFQERWKKRSPTARSTPTRTCLEARARGSLRASAASMWRVAR